MTQNIIMLESFINHCDGMMIAEESNINEIGKRLTEILTWLQNKICELWNKLMTYVNRLKSKRSHKQEPSSTKIKKSHLDSSIRSITSETDQIFDNLDRLVTILSYKFKRISYALFESKDLKYDSKEVSLKPSSEIMKLIETNYEALNRRCISHIPDEIKYDKNNRGEIAKDAILDIYESLDRISKIFESIFQDEEFNNVFKNCQSYMMSIFVPKVQSLKPLKEELNKTIEVLRRGVPIYSGNRTYVSIVHEIIGNASADWSSLNSLYVRVLNTFKEYDTVNVNNAKCV